MILEEADLVRASNEKSAGYGRDNGQRASPVSGTTGVLGKCDPSDVALHDLRFSRISMGSLIADSAPGGSVNLQRKVRKPTDFGAKCPSRLKIGRHRRQQSDT